MAATSFIRLALVVIVFGPLISSLCTTADHDYHCQPSEREALLVLKQGMEDPYLHLSSWSSRGSGDCCQWAGVECDNRTGNVVKLDLSSLTLAGEINPSLLSLRHLRHLDLSDNAFGNSTAPIPSFIGSFPRLRYLNLSSTSFKGIIPHQLGNLSSLRSLDLSRVRSSSGEAQLTLRSSEWLSRLSGLRHLDMGGVDLSYVTGLFQDLNKLSSISRIRLGRCQIHTLPESLFSHVNFTSLVEFDLSFNLINSTIPGWVLNLTTLEHLDLSFNNFGGVIPTAIGELNSLRHLDLKSNGYIEGELPGTIRNLCKLQFLDLSKNIIAGTIEKAFLGCVHKSLKTLSLSGNRITGYLPDCLGEFQNLQNLNMDKNPLHGPVPNSIGKLSSLQRLSFSLCNLSGPIPETIGELSSLEILDLSMNKLNGTIPEGIGQLGRLQLLSLNENSFEGLLTESHLSGTNDLYFLDLSLNSNLAVNIASHWRPGFHLEDLIMGSCIVGSRFPEWIQTQNTLVTLNMSSTGLSGNLPVWIWNFSSSLESVLLYNNSLTGRVPNALTSLLGTVDLRSNYLDGPLPMFNTTNLAILTLSDNSFSGPILVPIVDQDTPGTIILSLSNNKLSGTIPSSLCKWQFLDILDLSKNNLSGEVPGCLIGLTAILNLEQNNLSGAINYSSSADIENATCKLKSLHLDDNNLHGVLPISLRNCNELVTLDVAHNRFSGNIPTWIAQSNMPKLTILAMRSNMFSGGIPRSLSSLASLQVLDLADNGLSGSIPSSFDSFSAMKLTRGRNGTLNIYDPVYYEETITLATKGGSWEYGRLLVLVTSIDLSANQLYGEIPEELENLLGLRNLNLSDNHLTGKIPETISRLRSLESLDLSRNNLSGAIPQSMSYLTSLSHLNLSFNNFFGRIPTSNQFQTMTSSSYLGNPYLCGFPLQRCLDDQGHDQHPNTRNGEAKGGKKGDFDVSCIYLGMGVGFAFGFWAVFGTLLFKRAWRHAYFTCTDKIYDMVYIWYMVNFKRLATRNGVRGSS